MSFPSSFNSCWLLLLTRPSFHILVVTYTFSFQLFGIAHFRFIWNGERNSCSWCLWNISSRTSMLQALLQKMATSLSPQLYCLIYIYFFPPIFFFPSYNYFLSCATCPYISGSLKRKTCFRYLATEESFVSLGYSFLVGKNTIQSTAHVPGKAIWKILQPKYIWQSLCRKNGCELQMSSTTFVKCLIA